MELPLRAVRAIFSDIDGTLVHYAHVLERSGYCLNGADADKDGGLTEFVHRPTGTKIPVLKVPSTTLSGGYVSKKTMDLVADLRARGVIFCLLTGARTRTFMKRHETRTIPLPDFGVCEGGGKIFTFNEPTGAAELDEEWIKQFAVIAGDWRQLDSDPLERRGLLWDCFREMHKAGYHLDAVSLSTGFYVDVRKGRKQKCEEDGQQAAKSTEEDSSDMFASLEAEEEAARGLFCGSESNFSDRFGVGFVMNLGKGHVAPIGCNKRKAVEYIMQKTGVVASESVALFDDENDLEFAELCAGGVVPSIAHSSAHVFWAKRISEIKIREALRTRLDPESFLQPAVGGFLAIESGLEAILAIVKRQQQK